MSLNKIRYIILILVVVESFTVQYTGDILMTFQGVIQQEFGISMFEYQLLNSVHGLANIIFQLLNMSIIQYYGDVKCNICFVFLLILSQSMITLGSLYQNFKLLLIAKTIQGIAVESISLTIKLIISRVFRNHQISLVFSVIESSSRLGSGTNNIISPSSYSTTHQLWIPLSIGIILALISFFCGLLIPYFNNKILHHITIINLEQNLISQDTHIPIKQQQQQQQQQYNSSTVQNLKSFNKSIIYIISIKCLLNITINTYLKTSCNMLQTTFNLQLQQASLLIGTTMFGSCFVTPIIGKIIDNYFKCHLINCLQISIFLLFSGFLTTSILPFFGFVHYYGFIPLIFIILCLSIQPSVIWPLYSIIIQSPHLLGIAASTTYFITNVGYTINPLLYGTIYDFSNHQKHHSFGYSLNALYLNILLVPCFWFAYKLNHVQKTNIHSDTLTV